MVSLQKQQKGFTIVELLIVIVVIGILAALVVTTFSGIQQKTRNTERETDIKAVHGQLEAFYAQNGRYPTLGNLNDSTTDTSFVKTQLKGLDREALKDPKGTGYDLNATNPAPANSYNYVATPSGCDNTATDCTGYTITAVKEGGGSFEKKALN
jgi:type II secretion system protein G